jgi:phosphatidylserine decarboxylase
MAVAETSTPILTAEPLPANITSVQPGGGFCYRVELVWGSMRRAYLRSFRKSYIRRMAELRTGSTDGAPHEIYDSRDLKYSANQCTARWPAEHDPFTWRRNLPVTHWGLCELQIFGWPLLAAAIALALLPWPWSLMGVVPAILLLLVAYFFRNPRRAVPAGPGVVVAPADGTIVDVAEVDHDAFIGGPAVRIGIFLSIFNVHINRSPAAARVVRLVYRPGEFLNALKPESAERNESLWIGLQETSPPFRRMAVRQISGLIARRIVCRLRPGEAVDRGEVFGMIKLGSRTELIVPYEKGITVGVTIGQKAKAGETVLVRYGAMPVGD